MAYAISAAFLLVALLAANALIPVFIKHRQIKRLSVICERKGVLALTFDDGPGPVVTRGVLDLLRRYDVKATFFVLGKHAAIYPDLIDQIVNGGHELGSHGYAHLNAWKVGPWKVLKDASKASAVLGGKFAASNLFRPPYGKTTALTWFLLTKRGARLAWWTDDSGDAWRNIPREDEVVARIINRGGGVVLLHDFDRKSSVRIEYVLRVTESLLSSAQATGIKVDVLGSLYEDNVTP